MCHGPSLLKVFGNRESFTLNYRRLSEALFVLGLRPEELLQLLCSDPGTEDAGAAQSRMVAVEALENICEGRGV